MTRSWRGQEDREAWKKKFVAMWIVGSFVSLKIKKKTSLALSL